MSEQDNEKTRQETDRRSGPLDGLLVADFARVLAGPYATMLLGDLGATVIKVESPGGDDTRTWLPPDYEGVSTPFWRHDDPTRRTQHLAHFEKNLAILGGLLVVVLGTP